jgi:hypothetical protein
MITLITSVQFQELTREDLANTERPPWQSRQQLRALYFAQEQEGFDEIPTKRRRTFRLTRIFHRGLAKGRLFWHN